VIAGGATNLINRFAGGFQQTLSVMNADASEVSLRPVPGGGHEASIKRTDAESELRGQFGGLEGLVDMGVDVLLDLMDDNVVMGPPGEGSHEGS
jgi:hypothetical protein